MKQNKKKATNSKLPKYTNIVSFLLSFIITLKKVKSLGLEVKPHQGTLTISNKTSKNTFFQCKLISGKIACSGIKTDELISIETGGYSLLSNETKFLAPPTKLDISNSFTNGFFPGRLIQPSGGKVFVIQESGPGKITVDSKIYNNPPVRVVVDGTVDYLSYVSLGSSTICLNDNYASKIRCVYNGFVNSSFGSVLNWNSTSDLPKNERVFGMFENQGQEFGIIAFTLTRFYFFPFSPGTYLPIGTLFNNTFVIDTKASHLDFTGLEKKEEASGFYLFGCNGTNHFLLGAKVRSDFQMVYQIADRTGEVGKDQIIHGSLNPIEGFKFVVLITSPDLFYFKSTKIWIADCRGLYENTTTPFLPYTDITSAISLKDYPSEPTPIITSVLPIPSDNQEPNWSASTLHTFFISGIKNGFEAAAKFTQMKLQFCHFSCATCNEHFLINKCKTCPHGSILILSSGSYKCNPISTKMICGGYRNDGCNICDVNPFLGCNNCSSYNGNVNLGNFKKCVGCSDELCSKCEFTQKSETCLECPKDYRTKGSECTYWEIMLGVTIFGIIAIFRGI